MIFCVFTTYSHIPRAYSKYFPRSYCQFFLIWKCIDSTLKVKCFEKYHNIWSKLKIFHTDYFLRTWQRAFKLFSVRVSFTIIGLLSVCKWAIIASSLLLIYSGLHLRLQAAWSVFAKFILVSFMISFISFFNVSHWAYPQLSFDLSIWKLHTESLLFHFVTLGEEQWSHIFSCTYFGFSRWSIEKHSSLIHACLRFGPYKEHLNTQYRPP